MRKIVLINPPLSLGERYGRLKQAGNSLPNLGLCYLASVARQKGWKTEIIDCPVLGLSIPEVVKKIKKDMPDIVGLTVATPALEKAGSLMRNIKESSPEILSLVGGPHISAVSFQALEEFDCFDIGIVGEGEITLKDILEYKEGKKNIQDIEGIVYRDNGQILSTKRRAHLKNIDDLPLPAWDLLPKLDKFYRPSLQCVKRLPATILVTSRGCPYRCKFCDHSVFGYSIRYHSNEYVINMIKYLKSRYGIKEFAFHDECLLSLKVRAFELAECILKEKLDISWTVQARADQIDKEVLKIFKKAGCWQIQLGIESGSRQILKNLNKEVSLEQIIQACNQIKESGLRLKGFFMLGNPGETQATVRETLDFALKLPLDDFQCTFFTPYPGSQIYQELDKWGVMLTEDSLEMNQYNVCFLPFSLDKSFLEKEFRRGYKRFYLRYKIIKDYLFRMRQPCLWGPYLRGVLAFLNFAYEK